MRRSHQRPSPGSRQLRRLAIAANPSPAKRRDATVGGVQNPRACPAEPRRRQMKVSYFENGRYVTPPGMPRGWPVPSGAYDPETGTKAYHAMIDRLRFVEELGFDWISLSEHHYSPRILTPSVT